MAANADRLDEGLLASAYSWMRKAGEDKLDGGWAGCWAGRGELDRGRHAARSSRAGVQHVLPRAR